MALCLQVAITAWCTRRRSRRQRHDSSQVRSSGTVAYKGTAGLIGVTARYSHRATRITFKMPDPCCGSGKGELQDLIVFLLRCLS
jgi:hypothetical protein